MKVGASEIGGGRVKVLASFVSYVGNIAQKLWMRDC